MQCSRYFLDRNLSLLVLSESIIVAFCFIQLAVSVVKIKNMILNTCRKKIVIVFFFYIQLFYKSKKNMIKAIMFMSIDV